MIKVAIVEDNKIFREGISFILEDEKDIELVSASENGQVFINELDNIDADLILMDIQMPEMNGIETTKLALEKKPYLNILALSMFNEDKYFYEMVHAGVKGFVLKEAKRSELINAIYDVNDGKNFFSPELLKNVLLMSGNKKDLEDISFPDFTEIEKELIVAICSSISLEEIASKENWNLDELKKIREKVFQKTNTYDEANLIMYAIKIGIVTL